MDEHGTRWRDARIVKHLLRRMFGGRSRAGFADTGERPACLIVCDTAASGDARKARIDLLVSECRKLGPADIFIVSPDRIQVCPDGGSGGEADISPEGLRKRMASRAVVVLFSSQYHVSGEWIRSLLDLSIAQGKSQVPETNKTTLCQHLMLKPHFLVLTEADARKTARRSSSRGFHAVLSELGPASHPPGPNGVEVTAGNVNTLYRQAALTSVPLTYIIETTNHCNYSCYMCPYHGVRQSNLVTYVKPGTETHMPWDRFRRLIDEISDLRSPYEDAVAKTIVPYNRGEFLLYPQWRDALSCIKERGLGAYFSSNGSLWTDDDVKFILEVHLDALQLSIDGFSEDTHSEIRLNSDYDKVVRTLKQIMKEREERGFRHPTVQLAHTVNERNHHRVRDYVDYWIGKVDALFLGPENFMEEENKNKRYKIQYVDIAREPDSLRPPCNTLLINMWIQSNGECHLCIGSKRTPIGNIHDSSLKEILASDIRREVIRCHSEGDYANPVCRNCEHWFSAYWQSVENERYEARLSPDTQYYTRKGGLEKWWS